VMSVDTTPVGIAISTDGTTAYVTNSVSNSVSVIDTATNTVLGTIDTNGFAFNQPYSVAFNPVNTGQAYVTNSGSYYVSVIDTTTNTVTGTFSIGGAGEPTQIAYLPDGLRAYVTTGSDSVAIIDTASNTQVGTIDLGAVWTYGVAVSGDLLYITTNGTYNMMVTYDITDPDNPVLVAPTVNFTSGTDPREIAISPDNTKMYIPLSGAGELAVLDMSNLGATPVTVATGSQPYNVAVSADGLLVYVSNSSSNTVSVVQTSDNTVIGTLNVGSSPRGIALNGNVLYVDMSGDGTVWAINVS